MKTPHFLQLAEIDKQHFITACRHGLVHLTWGRSTVRFTREEFRQLAILLERVADGSSPASIRDGEMRVTFRPKEDCEIQLGTLVLLLSPGEFEAFVQAGQEAVQRLDEFLASGAWDEEESEDTPPNFLQQLRQNRFSRN